MPAKPPASASAPPHRLTRAQQAATDLLTALPGYSMKELKTLWPKYFDVPPFSHQRAMVEAVLAYRVQEEAFGGLSRSARSRLEAVSAAWDQGKPPPAMTRARVRPGTRLLRSWRGDLHEVTVLAKGFEYRGTSYGSLSEIARKITGVQWSGPLFFGLKNTKRAPKGEAA